MKANSVTYHGEEYYSSAYMRLWKDMSKDYTVKISYVDGFWFCGVDDRDGWQGGRNATGIFKALVKAVGIIEEWEEKAND